MLLKRNFLKKKAFSYKFSPHMKELRPKKVILQKMQMVFW